MLTLAAFSQRQTVVKKSILRVPRTFLSTIPKWWRTTALHEIALRIGKEAATTPRSENGDDSPPLSISLFEGLVQVCQRRLKGKKWRND
jgi:hypothetical protein